MIEFKNVSVTYPGGVKALNNVSLDIAEGDFVIIVGMSGAGKSTLLRTVNNLVKPTEGDVIVDSRNVTNSSKKELKIIRSDIGMIFQTFNLVNRSSVLKNVLTGRLSQVSSLRSIFGLWPKDDKESRLGNIFDKYDFVLVRPDLYVYGGCDLENISNIIESLEDTFFLKL
jgi:phosphonate transport system ATP-binding protein